MIKAIVCVDNLKITLNFFDDEKMYERKNVKVNQGFLSSLIVEYKDISDVRNEFTGDIINLLQESVIDAQKVKDVFPNIASLAWTDCVDGPEYKSSASLGKVNYTFIAIGSLNSSMSESGMQVAENEVNIVKNAIFS